VDSESSHTSKNVTRSLRRSSSSQTGDIDIDVNDENVEPTDDCPKSVNIQTRQAEAGSPSYETVATNTVQNENSFGATSGLRSGLESADQLGGGHSDVSQSRTYSSVYDNIPREELEAMTPNVQTELDSLLFNIVEMEVVIDSDLTRLPPLGQFPSVADQESTGLGINRFTSQPGQGSKVPEVQRPASFPNQQTIAGDDKSSMNGREQWLAKFRKSDAGQLGMLMRE